MLAAPFARSPLAGGLVATQTNPTTVDAVPTVLAEIEFTAGTWTNVAAYLRAATVKRGKNRALDKVDPGSVVLTLDNAARTFDPEYTAGPYYGNLAPGKGIRLRARWNDGSTVVTYTLFTGFVDRLMQSWDAEKPNDSTATIEASDGLAKLAAASLGAPFEVSMGAESPAPNIWLRMGEAHGPYAYDRSGNSRHAVIVGSPSLGQESLLDHDNDRSITFPANAQSWVATPPVGISALPWTVEFWFAGELDVAVLGDVTYLLMPADGTLTQTGSLRVYGEHGVLDVDGVTKLAQYLTVSQWGPTTSAIVQAPSGLFDGVRHHVTITGETGLAVKLYVDGVEKTLNQSGTSMALRDVGFAIGNAYAGKGALTIDEFVAWNVARTSTQRTTMEFASSGWAADTGTARITRILDAAGWAAADRNITTAFDTTFRGTDLVTTALEHLRAIEATIEGRLLVDHAGTLRLLGRDEHLISPYSTSQFTLGDGGGSEIGYVESGAYVYDWDLIANVVRRVNGESTIEARDAASIASYGKRDQSDPAEVESEYLSLAFEGALAEFRVAHYAQPVAHIDGVTIMPRSNPSAAWPHALGRELGDRATFKRRPQDVGSAISRDVIIEGIQHEIRPGKHWATTFRIDAIDAQLYFLFDSTLWDATDWRFAA